MNLMDKILSIFFMQIFLFTSTSLVHGKRNNDTDKLSLLAFKAQILDDPLRVLSSWNESQHYCKWTGITCGRQHQRVTMLNLDSSKLKGQVSPYIGNLSFLRGLSLKNNNFIHAIPPELGRLFRLQILDLRNNSFSGQIPSNISYCSNLQKLGFLGNNFTGKLPQSFGSLSRLLIFDLQSNNFVGDIPPSFGNLSSLQSLSLGHNHLHGSIPNSFGQLKSLKILILELNNLTGMIPPSVYNLSSITTFSVGVNQLEGSLPPGLGLQTFSNLEIFCFFMNQFSGSIPLTISNASKLMRFEISSNKFTGKVPSFAGSFNLQVLFLDQNYLGNNEDNDLEFLSSLVNCTNLQLLVINRNNFGGMLPESIGNFSNKLSIISFEGNKISGRIPSGIGNLVNLEGLYMDRNQLTGPIPISIGKLHKLNDLYLFRNKLSGTIPSSLGNLTSLGKFSLALNLLEGSIPSSLGECRNLLLLDLSSNHLNGTIPKEVMSLASISQYLSLSHNRLSGSIPIEIGKLVNLGILGIARNNISGKIPESLGKCITLLELDLHDNLLQGTIPSSLSSLRGIENIDLSRNNLSSKIPTFFQNFPFLKVLNLSFNDLEGKVPIEGVFQNVNAISIMGNTRLCGGIIQMKLPPCSSNKKSKHKLLLHLKLIVPILCGLVALLFIVLILLFYWSRKERSQSASTTMIESSFLKVSYGDLLKATNGFSLENLLGNGSFGSVYKGILNHVEGRTIAVKVLNLQMSRASKSFISECEAMRSIRHRNLVKLLTACSSVDFQGNDFKALVYEFMVNSSLDKWLHPGQPVNLEHEHRHLSLMQKLNIAIDIASALDYLHNQCLTPIIHCDLKPSNVLLDSDMTACVADFGLAKFLDDNPLPHSSQDTNSIILKGSLGYAAPEYGISSNASTYGDVYSFGILMLEMLTLKRPTDDMFRDGLSLRNFVMMALPSRIREVFDPYPFKREEENRSNRNRNRMQDDGHIQECLISMAKIGVACSAEVPRERFEMSNVVVELCYMKDVLVGTKMPTKHGFTF